MLFRISGCFALFLAAAVVRGEDVSVQWHLTFEDNFEGPKLNYEKWTPEDPWGIERNNELQGYVIQAFEQQNGILRIRCAKQPTFYDGKKRDYRSGMMTTSRNFSQRYGKFEIRCRVPHGRGLWPAFWLLPEPPSWPPEIDVLEILGHETDRVYMSHHWRNPEDPEGDSESVTGEFQGPDFSLDFHTFTILWEPGRIQWLVDGVARHESTVNVPDVPMFLLVNLAVGGWADTPDERTRFPSDFEIDYVRVWEKQ